MNRHEFPQKAAVAVQANERTERGFKSLRNQVQSGWGCHIDEKADNLARLAKMLAAGTSEFGLGMCQHDQTGPFA
jgi:hypothetical protein